MVSPGAPAVAATEGAPGSLWAPMMAAALALPGLGARADEAQAPPGDGFVALRWLSYRDRQPGLDRIQVESPSLQLRLPLAGRWTVDATATQDAVTGASPRWHSAVSGASRMSDRRTAFDLAVAREGDDLSASLALASSDEHDFESRALSGQLRWSEADRNRSWTLGLGWTQDRITSVDHPELDRRRRTGSLSLGLTQVLSRADLVQLTLALSDGQGFYGDPYKALDVRPEARRQRSLLARWNHHFEDQAATLRTSWRLQSDSFGIRSQTLAAEWVASLGERFTLTPSARYYTQGAASFYYDPVYSFVEAPYPPGWLEQPPTWLSPDARLSAFGAVTLGLRFGLRWSARWSGDFKIEQYEQRASWRTGGPGSPGLAPLKATFLQVGLVHNF